MVKTIWSNDQVRPGPEHGDNQHHSQKQQIQQCTQHCSHVQSHYQFTLSQNITTSCYCSTTSLDRTLPTYCLAEWRPRPPSMEPCEGVDGIMGPSYGPSLRGRQDSNFLGTRVPILLWLIVLTRSAAFLPSSPALWAPHTTNSHPAHKWRIIMTLKMKALIPRNSKWKSWLKKSKFI